MIDSPATHLPLAGGMPSTSTNVARRSPAVEAALARSLFVIPSINGGSLLRRMLPTLRLPLHTVVVLDQGSIDDTEAVCLAAGVRLVQLGHPHSYTEAANIGARMAREVGCDFIFISNNDIAFLTDVGAELLAEMLDDSHLGIVAPSQLIIDEKAGQRLLAYRAEWHLDTMLFTHDIRALSDDVRRLEADLCELTCAAIRMAAIDDIGFLDNDFGFYYEDADFCFRLRQAGYSCAYLPYSQIEHYTSSTFSAGLSGRKRAYMAKNVEIFASKHLGYGFGRLVGQWNSGTTGGIGHHLPRYLQSYGLLDRTRPSLVCGLPGARPLDYLFMNRTDDSASGPPLGRLSSYRGLVATSEWGQQRLSDMGFEAVGRAPVGVETDIFHPWVAQARPFDEKTILWCGQNDRGAALDSLLEAWRIVRAGYPDARLIVMGSDVSTCLKHTPAGIRRWQNQTIADFPEDRISLREVTSPLTDHEWARIYRGVDVVISTRLHPDPDLIAAMACGTLAIFTDAGSGRDLAYPGALVYGSAARQTGPERSAGSWRPDIGAVVASLRHALEMDDNSRSALARKALPLIRSRSTWRSTCAGLNAALAEWQEPSRIGANLRQRWEDEMDRLTDADGQIDYEAVGNALNDEGDLAGPSAGVLDAPGKRVAAAQLGVPAAASIVNLEPHRRLVRVGRRIWRSARAIVSARNGKGRLAALAALCGALSQTAKLRLKDVLLRSGVLL